MPGDRIIAVDGEPIESFEELQTIVRSQPEETLAFTIERAGESLDVQITPRLRPRSKTGSATSTGSG